MLAHILDLLRFSDAVSDSKVPIAAGQVFLKWTFKVGGKGCGAGLPAGASRLTDMLGATAGCLPALQPVFKLKKLVVKEE